jgi:predicted anti-sigma-YlaC factor YlaD
MMKCEIIQDLMPSYIDGITGPESTREIEAHLEHCEACRAYRDSMKESMQSEVCADKSAEEIRPFKKARRKFRLLTALLLLVVIACAGILAYNRYLYY